MCKQIHLISRHINEKPQINILSADADENLGLEIDIGDEEAHDESQILMQQLKKKCNLQVPKEDITLEKET